MKIKIILLSISLLALNAIANETSLTGSYKGILNCPGEDKVAKLYAILKQQDTEITGQFLVNNTIHKIEVGYADDEGVFSMTSNTLDFNGEYGTNFKKISGTSCKRNDGIFKLFKTKDTANIQTKITQAKITQAKYKNGLQSVWINTKGRVRDISDQERSEFFSAVGSIKCSHPSGKTFTTAATIVDTNKGAPIIIFSGHSTCYENNQLLQPKDCSFYYEKNTGEIRAYQFTQIATKFDCNSPEESLDMAVAKLENFEATTASTVTLTDSISQERKVDDDGEITYPSERPNVYEDSTMLLAGYDARYNKIKISENCGLISNRTGLDHGLKAHDCISTPGYSGGPILQKLTIKDSNKHEYRLVCVHEAAKTFEKNDARYRLFTKETFGQCVPITRELVVPLFEEVGAW